MLAWSDPELETSCVSGARLSALTGDQVEAAQDLLAVVARAPRLSAITTFQSIRIGVAAGRLTLSVEEIDMHTRPFNSDGTPQDLLDDASLNDFADSEALLVDDLRVRGKSLARLAS